MKLFINFFQRKIELITQFEDRVSAAAARLQDSAWGKRCLLIVSLLRAAVILPCGAKFLSQFLAEPRIYKVKKDEKDAFKCQFELNVGFFAFATVIISLYRHL